MHQKLLDQQIAFGGSQQGIEGILSKFVRLVGIRTMLQQHLDRLDTPPSYRKMC